MASSSRSARSAWDAATLEDVGLAGMSGAGGKRPAMTRSMRDRAATQKRNVHGGIGELEFKRLARLERLELTNAWDPLERAFDAGHSGLNDQGESSDDEQARKRRKSEPRKSTGSRKQVFIADIIANEGAAEFLQAQARPSVLPAERVCDVTGKEGRYIDPLTGLYVHDRRAIALLREQTPAWLKQAAISPYWDTIRSIQGGDSS